MDHGNKATHVVYINCADTLQYSFASYLSVEFRRKGIHAFVNCNGAQDVIEGARASVVVFSKNYLSSTSCLDKLLRVLQCRRKNGQLVVPVFYGVSPADVVVPEHNSDDRIREWSSALQELRELPGHLFRERFSECELVEEIVKDVYEKLFPAENIGIDSKLLEIGHLLHKQTWGVRRIGIWGMPGIGKTTLAKAVFDQISGGYEASCFIKHFDKAFHEKGIHRLIGDHFGNIPKELRRVCLPRGKLSKKRTLVVLDDVYNPLVAESFLRGLHWFGPGSLIIIASRDKQVFRLCQINHVYEIQSLNENEALQLFSLCAFGKDIREQNLLKLSMEVIDYASGNPLALSFYGRELKGKKLSEMETTFLKLKLRTPCKIYDLFKSSYETLNKNEKNIFLDIACFFKGENVDCVMQLLEGCGFFPHVGIDALVEKCLLTISEDRVTMHRIIQDFGREIINGETVQIERRRRLWEPWTIQFLLEDDKLVANGDPKQTYTRALGSEHIEGIYMDTLNLIFDVKPAAFKNMCNLRFLKIYCSSYEMHCGLRLPKGLESLPYKLRLLHWENYPLRSLPQDFNPCHLVELNMPYSQLQKLWEGTKNLEMLKMVRLCHSQQLTEIDDICEAQNVELLDLQGCTKLQSFPAMCQLQHLRVVNLSGCREIKIFPEVSPNIEELHLQGTGIRELPISNVTLSQQAKLNRVLANLLTEFPSASDAMNVERLTSLVKVNSSNHHLSKLVCLNMKDCSNLRSLPDMVDLESLKVLDMSGCSELEHIQGFPRNLKELYIAGTVIKELPPLPQTLEVLNAHGCVSLQTIPSGFKQLPRYCTFSNCFSLSGEVVSEYLKNALAYVECTAREYQQKQESNKSLAFSFSVSSPAKENFTFHLHPGYSVLIRMSPSWRSTLVAFAILVEAAFSDDYQKATVFGFKCVCRWKDKEGLSHRLEKTFHCWTPGEGVQQFQKEHMFLFCDLNLHPSTSTRKDPDILADLIVLEIFPVNKQLKLIDKSCTVTRCGIYVINSAYGDASLRTSQPVLSLDCPKMLSVDEVEAVLRGLEEKDRFLFLYIACLVNDEEAELVAPLIASIGLGVSSGFKVLADNSLICISTDGVIVRRYLVETMGREFVRRQCMQPDSLELKHKPSVHSGELVGIEDHVADMNTLLSSKSEEVKVVGICGPSGKGEEIYSSMVEPVEPPNGLREQGKEYYRMWQTLFEIDAKYVPIKPIGRGSDSVVCSAVNRETNKKVAIKKILNVFEKRIDAVNTLREMNFLRHVRHENIISLNDVMLSGHRKNFKDVYMVYELMDTDLHRIIKSSQSLSDDYCKYFLFQLLQGLKYLHSVNMLHFNLKPGNLLVNANCDLKISDFGHARNICNNQFMTEYLAPELFLRCDKYGTSIDIWAVGCIFAEILGRKPIFPGTAQNQLMLIINVLGSQQDLDLQFINNPKTREYINSLKFSRGTHFSILYPKASPIAIDLLQRMLVFDPTKRITVVEALSHPYMAELELYYSKPNLPPRVLNIRDIEENMEEHTLREMMWNEMLYYHPKATASQKPSKYLMSS